MDSFELGYLCGQITTLIIFVTVFAIRYFSDKRKEN